MTEAAKPRTGRGRRQLPAADKPPRPKEASGASKRKEKKAADIKLIREGFAEVLVMPAMPAALKGDQWAVDHFSAKGPQLAERIATECERNETLRKYCLKAVELQSVWMLGIEGFWYLTPALMHYGLVPGAEALGVPVYKKPVKAAERAAEKPAPAPEEPEEGEAINSEVEEEEVDGGIVYDDLEAELAGAPPMPVEAV